MIQILTEDKERYEEAWRRGYKAAKAEIENQNGRGDET